MGYLDGTLGRDIEIFLGHCPIPALGESGRQNEREGGSGSGSGRQIEREGGGRSGRVQRESGIVRMNEMLVAEAEVVNEKVVAKAVLLIKTKKKEVAEVVKIVD